MSIDVSNQTKISTLIKSLTEKLCVKFEQLLTEDINLEVHAWYTGEAATGDGGGGGSSSAGMLGTTGGDSTATSSCTYMQKF